MFSNPDVRVALVALAAVVVCAFVQRNVIKVPVIGDYLPQ